MEDKTPSTLFDELRNDVSSYVKSTVQLSKLEVYEKVALGSSVIAYSLILMFFILFALALVFITFGLYLGELIGNMWAGFGIVSLATIFIVLVLVMVKRPFRNSVTNRVIEFLTEDKNKQQKN